MIDMNNKNRKLKFIRYKNFRRSQGIGLPKWKLKNHKYPYVWENIFTDLLEDRWMVDLALNIKELMNG